MFQPNEAPKNHTLYKSITLEKWTPQSSEPKRGDWANYKLFDDESVRPAKRNLSAIPRFTRLSDRVCALVIQSDISNQDIHRLWDFDFTSNGSMTQTRPNIGAAAMDDNGHILTYRRYALQGHEIQVTRDTEFTPIEQPGVRREERKQVLAANSPEPTNDSPPPTRHLRPSTQVTPTITPAKIKRRLPPRTTSQS